MLDKICYDREDWTISSPNGTLQASIFYDSRLSMPTDSLCSLLKYTPSARKLKCVIYCHSNSGSRNEGYYNMLRLMDPSIIFIVFDFSGCGKSDLEHITYGLKEICDIKAVYDSVVQRYGSQFNISEYILFGFSMGAHCAIKYILTYPDDINKIIIDSCYINLFDVINDMYSGIIGSCITGMLVNSFDEYLRRKYKFSIYDAKCENLDLIRIPILIMCPMKDQMVNKSNSINIFDLVGSEDKFLYKMHDKNHNDYRDFQYFNVVTNFIENYSNLYYEVHDNLKRELLKGPNYIYYLKDKIDLDLDLITCADL